MERSIVNLVRINFYQRENIKKIVSVLNAKRAGGEITKKTVSV